MLYPLSYEGASGQCNDLRVDPRWQGATHVEPALTRRSAPTDDHTLTTPGGSATIIVDPR
ncbi:hypothetical protein MILUP08_40724 [Micromonospora lupini str. Lupac 08]|uniref:Uncharacterized protein n=1 Tax=Micromonospora lupini str. Lupac 08 TaxID=1150864 RepID=I0KW66_9ACTN|nr:hypothetical protein MILUP08_40724 [Micromonospora lupini str. Lupac 08]